MLSYQWDTQSLVQKVYDAIRAQGLKAWMDIHGGIKGNINERSVLGFNLVSQSLRFSWLAAFLGAERKERRLWGSDCR